MADSYRGHLGLRLSGPWILQRPRDLRSRILQQKTMAASVALITFAPTIIQSNNTVDDPKPETEGQRPEHEEREILRGAAWPRLADLRHIGSNASKAGMPPR
ncbi:hypothetical protein ABIF65_005610 [Bradyrhizobium japonicum]|nr:hypothetical protein [Bradyrhizobium japonicum]MCP1782235.1 hypothetical protein [Bradyrhizobium japonicum]MCP1861656.1 hypothetical protein [Bradyrhizobium japonicum]MCP1892415.1 hypothetical protein [Bradyrhizobium japonicum]MCP1965477.1 hypothetical protein [Bradyrhizobium japonicum]